MAAWPVHQAGWSQGLGEGCAVACGRPCSLPLRHWGGRGGAWALGARAGAELCRGDRVMGNPKGPGPAGAAGCGSSGGGGVGACVRIPVTCSVCASGVCASNLGSERRSKKGLAHCPPLLAHRPGAPGSLLSQLVGDQRPGPPATSLGEQVPAPGQPEPLMGSGPGQGSPLLPHCACCHRASRPGC